MSLTLCRDCFTHVPQAHEGKRCPNCHRPRLLMHDELDTLSIAHLDCDAFYAAVEKRDNPDLANKPVIIGGGQRGVVSTACYIARTYGIHSAQPMFKALKACPDAVVVRPDMQKYTKVGRQIREMMRALTPMVEPLSIDEAFLDLSGTERLHGHTPAETMMRLVTQIEQEIGITVSVGLSYCKFLAKVASDLDKPKGFSVIGQKEAKNFLAEQPVKIIWGVGKQFQKKLARDGITKIGQLQKRDEKDLAKKYGTMGLRLAQLSQGQDARSVKPNTAMKSMSAETTFNGDYADYETLSRILWSLSEKVSRRMKAADIAGGTLVLKLKTKDFKGRTRNRKLATPTQLAETIFEVASELLAAELDGTEFRLLGVGLSHLCDAALADQPDLLNPKGTRRAEAERAMDAIRDKFGKEAIGKGRGMKG